MIEITEEYLNSSTATLLVKAYRELKTRNRILEEDHIVWQNSDNVANLKKLEALTNLTSRLIHTIRSGVIAASNVEAMTEEAKRLGVYK